MSQFDEDKHIEAVLAEIGHGSKVLCDIGARYDGSNSAKLIEEHGWTGVLVDKAQAAAEELTAKFPKCKVLHLEAKPEAINTIVPDNCRFLSIDVDSCDWWLWANLVHRPALVVIETNPAPGLYVANMGPWTSKPGYGCSVDAAVKLGELKGYQYLGRTVVNAFFVAREIPCAYRLPGVAFHQGVPCSTANNVLR